MVNLLNLVSRQPRVDSDVGSSKTDESIDITVGNCPCCATYVKIPETVVKYKCSVCQSTVALTENRRKESRNFQSIAMNYNSLKQVVRSCEANSVAGAAKHEVYKPVEEYVEKVFGSEVLLNKSFLLDSKKKRSDPSNIDFKDLESCYNLLIALPTIRPYFKLLLSANQLLKRPPYEISHISNVRWLLILFEIPTIADCLYHNRKMPNQNKQIRLHVPEIKSISYEIIKRIIGYLANSNSESLAYLSSFFSSLPVNRLEYKVQLLNLYVTFHLTRLLNRSKGSGLSQSNKANHQLAANSPTFNEYNESSKLNTSSTSVSLPPRTTSGRINNTSRPWIQLPASIQNGFSDWGVWRSVFSSDRSTGSVSEVSITNDLKLKVSDYGSEWHLKSAARLLSILFVASKSKLPIYTFYNTLLDYIQVKQDFETWENNFMKPINNNRQDRQIYDLLYNGLSSIHNPSLYPPRPQLTFCQYPFLLSLGAKISILEFEARKTMERKAEEAFLKALDKRKVIDVNLKFLIRRDHIILDSLNCIKKNQADLKKALRIEFLDEPGIDAGGLKKEWFMLLTKELFNVKGNGMFQYNEESHLCWFAPMPIERNDELYYMLGVVLGLAIYNSIILELRFPLALYKKLLDKKVGLDDYTEMFPATGEGLRKILFSKPEVFEDVGLTFETEFKDFYGHIISRPLIPNGANSAVTYRNRKEYVHKWVDFYLNEVIKAQFQSFYNGFHLVIGGNALSLFAPKEIEMLICGYNESKIETGSFKSITKYNGWTSTNEAIESDIVKWFWEWFDALTYSKQKLFLTFVTGSDRIPATGISTMNFKISRLRSFRDPKVKKLPVAHTCFNELCIFDYENKEEMFQKLDMSITESEGFGLK